MLEYDDGLGDIMKNYTWIDSWIQKTELALLLLEIISDLLNAELKFRSAKPHAKSFSDMKSFDP